jgi:hypothetical protein
MTSEEGFGGTTSDAEAPARRRRPSRLGSVKAGAPRTRDRSEAEEPVGEP